MFIKKTKGKFNTLMNVVTVTLTVKAAVWDKLTPEQKTALLESAKGALSRTKAQGGNLLSTVKAKKDDILKRNMSK